MPKVLISTWYPEGLEAAPPGLAQPKKSLDKWTKVVGSALDMFEISMYLHTNYKKKYCKYFRNHEALEKVHVVKVPKVGH